MAGIWEELKTRKIFKAATIYAAVAWGIIQIADILLPVLGIQEWIMSSMVLIAFAGFPLALILGWMLDLKLERKRLASSDETAQPNLLVRATELIIITAFGMTAAFIYYNSSSEPVTAAPTVTSPVSSIINTNLEQKTIAVLPFASFSDSNEDEYFADGLSEELLNVLARNKKLRVAARTSSFQYKNTNINVKTIARELGVDYILEGSVRRSGELIRVTAQLINANEDVHIFSKSWDRDLTNIFRVQDEIAKSVSNELKVSLLGEKDNIHSEIGTQSIAAFADYSRGQALIRNRGKADFEGAIEYFQQALKIDPDYAEAMVMLAEAYLLQASYGLKPLEEAQELAKPLINSALAINSELGVGHSVSGLLHWQLAQKSDEKNGEKIEKAKYHLLKAIQLNPSLAEAYMWYGSILQGEGNFKDSIEMHKRAYEIDPRAAVVGFNWAHDLIRLGDYQQAMNVFNSVVRNNPNYPQAYSIAGSVSYAVGQLDQAYNMYARMANLTDDDKEWLLNSTRVYIPLGAFEKAQANVDKLKETPNLPMEKYSFLQASIWLASNQEALFFNWVETFDEDTSSDSERLWRGIAFMKKEQWKYAAEDFSEALKQMRIRNSQWMDENTIRVQLFLAKSYLEIGNQLKADEYLTNVKEEIAQLRGQGLVSQESRFQQAAYAALSNNDQQAISLLGQAVREGFVDFWWVENDPTFDNIRSSQKYQEIKDEFEIRMRVMKNKIERQFFEEVAG